jgi:hypothetical protein
MPFDKEQFNGFLYWHFQSFIFEELKIKEYNSNRCTIPHTRKESIDAATVNEDETVVDRTKCA